MWRKSWKAILTTGVVALLLAVQVRGKDQPQFSSPKARSASAAYEAAAKRAEGEYRARMAAITREYRESVTQARTAATRAGELAEANRIELALKSLDQETKARQGEMVLKAARYGIGNTWVDVTSEMNAFVKPDGLTFPALRETHIVLKHDPVPGYSKILEMTVDVDGHTWLISLGGDNNPNRIARVR